MSFNNVRSGPGPTEIPTGGTPEEKKKISTIHRKLVGEETLHYPVDFEGQPFYPESIKFTVYKRHGASLKKIQQKVGDLANTLTNAFKSGKGPNKKQQEEIYL